MKIVLIGNSGVGKTSIFYNIIYSTSKLQSNWTIGPVYGIKLM